MSYENPSIDLVCPEKKDEYQNFSQSIKDVRSIFEKYKELKYIGVEPILKIEAKKKKPKRNTIFTFWQKRIFYLFDDAFLWKTPTSNNSPCAIVPHFCIVKIEKFGYTQLHVKPLKTRIFEIKFKNQDERDKWYEQLVKRVCESKNARNEIFNGNYLRDNYWKVKLFYV
ncbi:hypothetical protein MHBO_003938 [Bonamia ostreae]|uniref:PH domain-containing protein n=1 Tax=Bonamia ostreae TaxID=126728 RepID=A0ABV2ARY6_9EUKA